MKYQIKGKKVIKNFQLTITCMRMFQSIVYHLYSLPMLYTSGALATNMTTITHSMSICSWAFYNIQSKFLVWFSHSVASFHPPKFWCVGQTCKQFPVALSTAFS